MHQGVTNALTEARCLRRVTRRMASEPDGISSVKQYVRSSIICCDLSYTSSRFSGSLRAAELIRTDAAVG